MDTNDPMNDPKEWLKLFNNIKTKKKHKEAPITLTLRVTLTISIILIPHITEWVTCDWNVLALDYGITDQWFINYTPSPCAMLQFLKLPFTIL